MGNKIMKQITKFIIFKVVELTGAFLVWWGLSWYGHWICSIGNSTILTDGTMGEYWLEAPLCGIIRGIFIPALGLGLLVLFGAGLYKWIKWNWKKAGEWTL